MRFLGHEIHKGLLCRTTDIVFTFVNKSTSSARDHADKHKRSFDLHNLVHSNPVSRGGTVSLQCLQIRQNIRG